MLLMGKYVMTMNKEKRSTKDIVFKCTYNDGGVGQNGIGSFLRFLLLMISMKEMRTQQVM